VDATVPVGSATVPTVVDVDPQRLTELKVTASDSAVATLVLFVGNTSMAVPITVVREPPSSFTIDGATMQGVAVTAKSADFARDVVIRNNTNAAANVSVLVGPVHDPNGSLVVVVATINAKPAEQPAPVGRLQTVSVHLAGTLTLSGTYAATSQPKWG
ncbi:MAG: hypothetical protein ACRDQZ_24935, partial [Mycobacteriales bacterium]